jgi:predicted dehydrogenase
MQELKFAVIGLGNMGKIHAANLLAGRVKGVVLTSACDIDREALDWGHKNLSGVNLYQDYQEMLKKEKLDAVVVVTPHYSHIQIAIDCLKAHLHVLVEKPLAVTAMEGKTLVELHASCPDLVAGVAFNQRSNNVYKEAKKLLPLSNRGLPCPNLSAGYENAHGRFEYVPIQSMMKNVEILLELTKIFSDE